MKTYLALSLLILLSFLPAKVGSEEVKLSDENLARAVSTAIANNPSLKASDSRWQVFKNRVRGQA